MTAVSVGTGLTTIVAPKTGANFIHIRNMHGSASLYVSYDGTAATTADGMAVLFGETLKIDGQAQCSKGMTAIAGTTIDVRVQTG